MKKNKPKTMGKNIDRDVELCRTTNARVSSQMMRTLVSHEIPFTQNWVRVPFYKRVAYNGAKEVCVISTHYNQYQRARRPYGSGISGTHDFACGIRQEEKEMESLTKQFPDKETFDKFFVENFKTMTYEDVKEGLEELVKAEGLNIFQDDYVKNVRKEDFKEHLSKGARFEFENAMTEAFYDKNPEVYEAAFGLYEEVPKQAMAITETFHRTYQEIYEESLNCMFDAVIAPLL